jgi:hypothetical protein
MSEIVMDRTILRLVTSTSDPAAPPEGRRSFSAELDCRGLFLNLGPFDAYVCFEAASAWFVQRELGDFDIQAWRLHLIVSRVPC